MVIRSVSVLLEQLCNVSDCMLQVINRLALNIACQQLVNSLWTCYNLFASLLQLVRFYACTKPKLFAKKTRLQIYV